MRRVLDDDQMAVRKACHDLAAILDRRTRVEVTDGDERRHGAGHRSPEIVPKVGCVPRLREVHPGNVDGVAEESRRGLALDA